jgi:hypothetical protein
VHVMSVRARYNRGGEGMKLKTGLKAGQDRSNNVDLTIIINQNSGDGGSAG